MYHCLNCSHASEEKFKFCPTCGTEATATADKASLIGKVLNGKYRIIEEVGAGAMGTVYRAEQVSLKKPIAIKVLHQDLMVNDESVRRFHAEGIAAGKFTHPSAIQIFDFDKDGIPDIVRTALGHRAPGKNIGSVFVLSGRDGKVLAQADSDFRTVGSSSFGVENAVLKPPPGSDVPLFALVQPTFQSNGKTNNRGRIAVYRGMPSGVRDFGSKCKGPATQRLPEIGLRNLGGNAIRLQLANAKPGSTAFLFLGYSNTKMAGAALPFKLDNFGFTGCSLLTSSDVILPILTGRSGIDAGYGRFDLNVPLAFPGSITLYGQWAFIDNSSAGVWGFTRGLRWGH